MGFPADWNRKASITIDAGRVAGSGGTLPDFPVLLTAANLPSEVFDSDGKAPAQADGGDLRFTSDEAGETPIALEVVRFATDPDPAMGAADIRVSIPNLSQDADTTIYVWWNTDETSSQPPADDPVGRNAVWENGFLARYHWEGTALDSTGNGHDAVLGSEVFNSGGLHGQALEFLGDSNTGVELVGATAAEQTEPAGFARGWFKSLTDTGAEFANLVNRDGGDYWTIRNDQAQAFPQ